MQQRPRRRSIEKNRLLALYAKETEKSNAIDIVSMKMAAKEIGDASGAVVFGGSAQRLLPPLPPRRRRGTTTTAAAAIVVPNATTASHRRLLVLAAAIAACTVRTAESWSPSAATAAGGRTRFGKKFGSATAIWNLGSNSNVQAPSVSTATASRRMRQPSPLLRMVGDAEGDYYGESSGSYMVREFRYVRTITIQYHRAVYVVPPERPGLWVSIEMT